MPGASASAADPPPRWTGFYFGGHLGALWGTTSFSDPGGAVLYGNEVATPGFLAGLQLGYDWLLQRQWLVGLQADASLASSHGNNTCLQSSAAIISSNCKVTPRAFATLTGRVGGLTEPGGRTLLYAKGGLAWTRTDVSIEPNNSYRAAEPGPPTSLAVGAWGWTLGAGIEHAFRPAWSLFAEYDYLRFDNISMPTPETIIGTSSATLGSVPPATTNLTLDQHLVSIGLNYRFGAPAMASAGAAEDVASPPAAPREPGWEYEVGARYWYSWGKYQNSNGSSDMLVSQLTYTGMQGHTGELFGRIDSPFNVFVKAVAGGGFIATGKMYDEDWGSATSTTDYLAGYSRTESDLSGSMSYLTADVGYDLFRGAGHKIGPFIGYNRFQLIMSAKGCAQLVNPEPPVCVPSFPTNTNSISELDTWQSLRVGVSAELRFGTHLKLSGDFAYLPYVGYDGIDIHHLREPVKYFPWLGTGNGVQAELILSYQVTDALSFGLGGRYWAMWTNYASQADAPGNILSADTEWTGVLVQASYKFPSR